MTYLSWEDLRALDVTAEEAAKIRGVSTAAARSAARRRGIVFRKAGNPKAKETLARLTATPEFERKRKEGLRLLGVICKLSPEEKEQYYLLRRKGKYKAEEALALLEKKEI